MFWANIVLFMPVAHYIVKIQRKARINPWQLVSRVRVVALMWGILGIHSVFCFIDYYLHLISLQMGQIINIIIFLRHILLCLNENVPMEQFPGFCGPIYLLFHLKFLKMRYFLYLSTYLSCWTGWYIFIYIVHNMVLTLLLYVLY